MPASAHVLQACAWYPPYDLGGTEVYLEGLVGGLRAHGIDSILLVPRHRLAPERYRHRDTDVTTYPVNAEATSAELRGGDEHARFGEFVSALQTQKSRIYHQHSWTRGCGPRHLRAARTAGLRTVLTVHVPNATCLRGTMLKFGAAPCDGKVDARLCGACWAEGRGAPTAIARLASSLPVPVARFASRMDGRLATLLSAREIGEARVRQIAAMASDADRIVAVCRWLYDSLAACGVPAHKLVLNRQGLSLEDRDRLASAAKSRIRKKTLRLLYLGRWDPVKGVEIAVNAVRALPASADVTLRICAVPAPDGETRYEHTVRAIAAGDRRIHIDRPLQRSEIAAALAASDALLVPSNWLETGPLVVLEAQAAGVFVLGSRLGGIAELVDETDGGTLLPPRDVPAWTEAIMGLWLRHQSGPLSGPKTLVRGMDAVAAEMAELYRGL